MAFQTSNGSPNITITPPKLRKKKILGLLSQAPVSCTSISQEDVQNMSFTVHATNKKELLKILELARNFIMEAGNMFTRRVDKLMVFEQPVSRKRRYPGNSITNWTNIKNTIYHQAHFRYQTSIVISAQHVKRKSRQPDTGPQAGQTSINAIPIDENPSPMVPRRRQNNCSSKRSSTQASFWVMGNKTARMIRSRQHIITRGATCIREEPTLGLYIRGLRCYFGTADGDEDQEADIRLLAECRNDSDWHIYIQSKLEQLWWMVK